MILLTVVPLSFLQKHFTYTKDKKQLCDFCLACGILFIMSKLHSHFKNGLQKNELGFNDAVILQFKTFLTMSDGHDKMVSMGMCRCCEER